MRSIIVSRFVIRRIQMLLRHVWLESATIFVKVTSPLDLLYRVRESPRPPQPKNSVGKVRLHFQEQPDEERSSTVTYEIDTPERPVYFTGNRVQESRPGFLTLQIPPLEAWEEPLR